MDYLEMACRVLLGVVFLVSAGSKLRNRSAFDAFAVGLRDTGLVSAGNARRIGVLTVAAELGVVLLLVVPATVPAGYLLAGALLAVFVGGIGLMMRRGVSAACPCFGVSTTRLGGRQIIRNVVLLTVAGTGLVAGLAGSGVGAGQWAGLLLAAVTGAIVALIVVRLDDIVDLFASTA
ncbi:methylamine utilization protein MauE [Plantactinospora sp. S1510]|uniref:Methylamine utilization protein MauE n=1 Tax=Plantactinospora alkalitolerans TaxID=2789879 RepID=A0ABS0GYK5_9ACTN|nr:MauE/DoxX family redox-associated membrane protein [Plantactinospora alkalitolerans]MBF9131290.1 methylamine utilization protein MauE [Plantactinospora alkalitolerans]